MALSPVDRSDTPSTGAYCAPAEAEETAMEDDVGTGRATSATPWPPSIESRTRARMLQLKYPGVYTQEQPSGVRAITGASTSVALFVGPTKAGIDRRRTRLFSFADFERFFGGLSQTSNLSYSVLHFFANGGGEAFVIRVPAKNAKNAETDFKRDDSTNTDRVLTVTALSSGLSGNGLFVEFDRFGINEADKMRFNMTVTDRLSGRVERFVDLTTASGDGRFAQSVVNDPATGSQLVSITIRIPGAEGPRPNGTLYAVGSVPSAGVFTQDKKLIVAVSVPDSTGSSTSGAFADLAVTVYSSGEAKPTSVLELANRISSTVNAAIRADSAKALIMEGATIEVGVFSSNKVLRVRVAMPGLPRPTKRVAEAQVTFGTSLVAPDSLLLEYGLSTGSTDTNPARYALGSPFSSSSQVSGAPTAGSDGDSQGQPDSIVFKNEVMALEVPDPFFNILCLPDLVRPKNDDPTAQLHANAISTYEEAARICAKKHAFLLIDPLPNVTSVGAAESFKSLTLTFSSTHAAAYFPNIRVDDPLVTGVIRSHPPSGAVAGAIARTDGQVGVWQAPAGTDNSLSGVYGPSVVLSDDEHGVLNPIGLNCIRQFPIFGTVVFGSRTLDGADARASEWKYIPVRRTASYILRTLSESLRWAVHKPNGEQLWSQLRLNVTAFMQGLFRQGAFKGVSARESYFVRCDATTTPQADIDLGIVNIVVGFAPLKPAEFVVITLRQIVQPSA